MTERWLPVLGFEGTHEVSDRGRVRSLDRVVETNLGPRRYRSKLLSPGLTSGHYTVDIGGRSRWVHHLVLEAFVGPRPSGQQCRHSNDIGTDNRLENLAWGTSSENAMDMVDNGNHHYARESTCMRGHLLVEPNLLLKARGRQCRSCNAGRAAFRAGRTVSVQVYADEFYARLGVEA